MRRLNRGDSNRIAALAVSTGLMVVLALTAPGLGQAPAPRPSQKGSEATTPDTTPLARFIPKEDLVAYSEFGGLDSYNEAWRKTAASKILTETSLGSLMESIVTQLADKALSNLSNRQLSGADAAAIVKHMLRSGFVFAVNGKASEANPTSVAFVIRGAARKEARAPFDRLVVQCGGPTTPQVVTKAGRTVVVFNSSSGEAWTCWNEKDVDLVFALAGPKSADVVIETLDGKRPNAVDHPLRVELAKTGPDGFQPVALGFLDLAALMQPGTHAVPGDASAQLTRLGFDGLKRLDYQWGFQGEALMSITRLQAPQPRKGLLTLIDQPTFDKESIPPISPFVNEFAVASIDLIKVLDQVDALLKEAQPGSESPVKAIEKAFQEKTEVRLREDLLAHLGPKMAFYTAPAKTSARGAGPSASGMFPMPKATLLIESDKPEALGKTLDALVAAVNRELKKESASKTKKGQSPGQAEGPQPEIKALPGPVKTYILSVPALEMLMPGLRPTVMVGKKYVVFSTANDSAKQALEAEAAAKGHRSTPAPLASAIDRLPAKLVCLSVSDRRNTMADEIKEMTKSLPQFVSALTGNTNQMGMMGRFMGRAAGGSGFQPGPGPDGGGAPAGNDSSQIQIDPALVPSADALKKHLFPGSVAVVVDDQGLRIETREAFPDVANSALAMGLILPAIQSARNAAAGQPTAGAPQPSAPPGPGRFGAGTPGPQPGSEPNSGQPGAGRRSKQAGPAPNKPD